jgi:hypothetical protein
MLGAPAKEAPGMLASPKENTVDSNRSPDAEEAMTRSEERLVAGTEVYEAGRARCVSM